ncbi:hypothetical protein PIB30_053675 [Stylosanthes scabra]|uniref:Uncharacterized protein n=1 Tax=Stylosanthes scabra TaxID=79078 RepID=A0ABU6TK47_9FABA|nr:hypothetical protein [Stylosanthes scabra]
MIELYVEFEETLAYVGGFDSDVGGHREITWYGDNSDCEDDFEAICGFNDKNENVAKQEEANMVGQIAIDAIARQQHSISGEATSIMIEQNARNITIAQDPFGVLSFMRVLDIQAMRAP